MHHVTGNDFREPGSWWRHGVLYQIYPLSFQDSDGDGRGDLRGVRARLDYLSWLGVDGVWINPFFQSPMVDFGYDISDHRAVDGRLGTMADAEALIGDLHRRELRVVVDLATPTAHPPPPAATGTYGDHRRATVDRPTTGSRRSEDRRGLLNREAASTTCTPFTPVNRI